MILPGLPVVLQTLLLFFFQSGPASAVPAADHAGWSWRVAPYLFAANIDGTVEIDGTKVETDVAFSDVLQHLDFAAALFLEGRHGPWGFLVDSSYVDLGEDGKGPAGVTREADLELGLLGLAGLYHVSPTSPFDAALGLRYASVKADVQVGPLAKSGDSRLLDVYVGGRAVWPFAQRWRFSLYGDVGTGDSDLTWQALANLGYDFGNWGLNFGYRILAYDFEDGSNVLDFAEEGLMLGLEYRF